MSPIAVLYGTLSNDENEKSSFLSPPAGFNGHAKGDNPNDGELALPVGDDSACCNSESIPLIKFPGFVRADADDDRAVPPIVDGPACCKSESIPLMKLPGFVCTEDPAGVGSACRNSESIPLMKLPGFVRTEDDDDPLPAGDGSACCNSGSVPLMKFPGFVRTEDDDDLAALVRRDL